MTLMECPQKPRWWPSIRQWFGKHLRFFCPFALLLRWYAGAKLVSSEKRMLLPRSMQQLDVVRCAAAVSNPSAELIVGNKIVCLCKGRGESYMCVVVVNEEVVG
jgi:hypothetical protein